MSYMRFTHGRDPIRSGDSELGEQSGYMWKEDGAESKRRMESIAEMYLHGEKS